ncbi:MAG: PTS sugar transporter subunit IIB [Gemmatimonadota bacterium]
MPIVLYRVDERLIHGQVVLGWGSELEPTRYLVVDDDVAEATWEQELYELGLPNGISAEFHTIEEARGLLAGWREEEARSVLLTRLPAGMRALGEGELLRDVEVNVGGIHHAEGREMVLPYVFLGTRERADLRALVAGGAEVSAQDVPAARPISVERLLHG